MRSLLSVALVAMLLSMTSPAVFAASPVSIEIVNDTNDSVQAWTAPHDIVAFCSPERIGAHRTATVTCQSDGGAFFLGVNEHQGTEGPPFCLVGQNGYVENRSHCSIKQTGASSYQVSLTGTHANENVDFTDVQIDVDNQTGSNLLVWTDPRGAISWCSPLPDSRIGAHQKATSHCKSIGGHFIFSVSGYSPQAAYCSVRDSGDNDRPDQCSLKRLGDLHYSFVVTGDHAY